MPHRVWARIDPETHRFVPYLTEEERQARKIRHRGEYNRKWYWKNIDTQRLRARERHRRIRLLCLNHYSGDPARCACCGETIMEFLSLDHINGGGYQHRHKIKQATLWEWLKRNNFPEGFRVLCYNCNMAIGHYGHCPHGEVNHGNQETRNQRF